MGCVEPEFTNSLFAKEKAQRKSYSLVVTSTQAEFLHSLSGGLGETELLFLPGLAGVSGDPDSFNRTSQLAMQSVPEFDPDNVIHETFAIHHGSHLCPVLAGIGRMEECASRASHPDVQTIRCQCTKNRLARNRNRLPGHARIKRPLQRAI